MTTAVPATSNLTVIVDPRPAVGRWELRLRPAGPAGELEARFPSVGLCVFTDRAQPEIALQLIVRSDTGAPDEATLELATILFGPASSRALRNGGAGPVAYEPAAAGTRVEVLALLALIATLGDRPAVAAADVAAAARALAGKTPPALARLLSTTATEYAFAAVAALRVLPPRGELDLDAAGEQVLDRMIARVGELAGSDVALGAIDVAEPPAWWDDEDDYFDTELAVLGAGERDGYEGMVTRSGTGRRIGEAKVVDLSHSTAQLPLTFDGDVLIVETGRSLHTVRGRALPIRLDAGRLYVVRDDDVPDDHWPTLWVRAVSADEEPMVLYQAQCRFRNSTFSAELSVVGEYPDDFTIEFTDNPLELVRSARDKVEEDARRVAGAAAERQNSAPSPADWAAAAELWRDSAQKYRTAGDRSRRALALIHALRAYLAAGDDHADEADTTRSLARVGLAQLDPGWMAPDPVTAARADPLNLASLLESAVLNTRLRDWAVRELGRLGSELSAPLSDDELAARERRITEIAAAAARRERTVLEARVRARVRLAVVAAESGSYRFARTLMYPPAIEYVHLDDDGRSEFGRLMELLLAEPPDSEP